MGSFLRLARFTRADRKPRRLAQDQTRFSELRVATGLQVVKQNRHHLMILCASTMRVASARSEHPLGFRVVCVELLELAKPRRKVRSQQHAIERPVERP